MKRPILVLVEKGIMGMLCAVWIIFGITTIGNDIVMGSLMILLGLVFGYYAFICRGCGGKVRTALYIFVVLNIILTLFDQIEFLDWTVLALCVILLAVMIINSIKHKNVC